jgi:SAM-dependent methyltransferase
MAEPAWMPAFICPRCASPLTVSPGDAPTCRACGAEIPLRDDIYRLLKPGRLQEIEPFLAQYRRIRGDDGYRQRGAAYYRSLPKVDARHPQVATWRVRQESFRNLVRVLRRFTGRPLRILDLGAGSGWLSARLTELGHSCVAVDWLDDVEDGLGAIRHYRIRFTCIQADFDDLPLAPGQFDVAIFNASLHYSNDAARTIRRVRETLAPGGILMVMDSPVFATDDAGRRMLHAQRIAFHSTCARVVPCGVGYLTESSLVSVARHAELRVAWIPSRGGLSWAFKRWFAGLKQHRTPARFGLWIGVSQSASS